MFRQSGNSNVHENRTIQTHKAWSQHFLANYLSFMRPYAFIARLMGFLPYKIVSSQFIVSKTIYIFSAIPNIAYLNCVLVAICKIDLTYFYAKQLFRIVHDDFIVVLSPVIFISAYVANRSMVRVMENISKVSQMLPPEFFSKSAKIIFIKDAILMGLEVSDLLSAITSGYPFSLTNWYTFFALVIMNSLFVNNLYVLNGCFKHINDSLVKVKNTLMNDEPHLLRRVYHMQKNPVLLTKLRTLKKQHLEVSETLQTLNDSFSMQCIGIITLLFIDITFNVYTCMLVYNKGGRIKNWASLPSFFIISNSVQLILMAWCAEITRIQMENMGTNIHRIIVHTFDDQVTSELKMFSLQVLQRDNTLMAKGLVIDATLLTKHHYIFTNIDTIFVGQALLRDSFIQRNMSFGVN
ncbi:unnamed protein product [Xylocopa violacea]|uniref:Gustatory receptor n=1 Tax=Xylocopa violacea TaxID=135666 RepID=A0ABP1PAZ8_XYLVO